MAEDFDDTEIQKTVVAYSLYFLGDPRPEGYEDCDVVLPELLERSRLDFSVESLHVVDRYLCAVHERKGEVDGRMLFFTALWAGAYVGEVLREHCPVTLRWVSHEELAVEAPEIARQLGERSLGTWALLRGPNGSMTLPCNKVVKLIDGGAEDSTHPYVGAEMWRLKRDAEAAR